DEVPEQLTVHVGTATVPARLRCFDGENARITLDWPLPLIVGDRLLLRDPARRLVLGGVGVLDPDPPRLLRRGDGTRRGVALAAMPPEGDVLAKVASRGAVEVDYLRQINLAAPDALPPSEVRELNGWWVYLPLY